MKISVLTPSVRPEYLNITQKTLEEQTFTDFEWIVEIGLRKGIFGLPEDMNKMLRRAQGDIIVSLQDCISIPSDALEIIATLPYEHLAYTYPVGKYKEKIEDVKWDWREYREKALKTDEITPNMWEIDFASAPKSLFFDIGGFDEEFKNGWGWDNVEVGWRAKAAGYTFKCSRLTRGYALDHDKLIEHPHRNKLKNNDWRARETAEKTKFEYKKDYLTA